VSKSAGTPHGAAAVMAVAAPAADGVACSALGCACGSMREPISGVLNGALNGALCGDSPAPPKAGTFGLSALSLRRNMRTTNIAATPSKAIINSDPSMPPIAPPMPKCDSSAPAPRPSKAPPSTPFQGLAGFGATGAVAGAAAGAAAAEGAAVAGGVFKPWFGAG